MAEYVILLSVVSLLLVSATVALGPPLVRWYVQQRYFLLAPIP